MKSIFIIILLFTSSAFAREGIYLSTSLFPVYGSGTSSEKSSLLGSGISFTGGLRLRSLGLEVGAKRFTTSNKQLGDDKYETEIKDSIFYGGGRLFLSEVFSLNLGLAIHYVEMDIYEGSNHLKSEEDGGESLGIYAGMGIMHPLARNLDVFYESTLYPISDIGLYFVDMQLGIRFYL